MALRSCCFPQGQDKQAACGFWSHSCKCMIDEDVWRLALRSSEQQATAVPDIKKQDVWLFAHSSSFQP